MPEWLPELAAAVLAVVFAITLHEAAHGYAARALGDDTAERMGRISLNPLRHVDPVGTLLVPGVMLVGQLLTIGSVQAMFGWAKPVPVDFARLRHPRRDMMLVAGAGPAMNFVLALFAGFAVHGVEAAAPATGEAVAEFLVRFCALSILSNLVLGLFNLIPLPPLDGGRILVGLLPYRVAMAVAGLERYGILIVLLGLFIAPQIIPAWQPMSWFVQNVVWPVLRLVLRMTGNE
ncbi:site-2 protease family protein [Plastoroseomonas arctica]|uniref:Site-2 protease family protein n=1 Tax=Plastoroseomonas arctica TaxID=1509237 RepID=A0AAF1KLU6_9PROT|nr:site-2 protease family protein [Plastoroseomonas arctica]MBR0655574.1 site-2 protease family protein [Plastoroseomonas arctica]